MGFPARRRVRERGPFSHVREWPPWTPKRTRGEGPSTPDIAGLQLEGLHALRNVSAVYMASPCIFCKSLPLSTAPYYREARVTFARRQTACGMQHCCARRIVETGGRRKLGCTSTRWAERQRIIGAEANRIVKPMAASVSNAATQALSLRRHESCSSSRLPIKAFLLGVKGGYSLSVEREYPP